MTRTTVLKKTGLAAAALALTTTGLAACGADESEPTTGSEDSDLLHYVPP